MVMTRAEMLKVMLPLIVLMGIVVHTGAQPTQQDTIVDRASQMAQQWEERSNNHLWVWTYDVSVWFTDGSRPGLDVRVPPKGAFHRKGLEIRICKHGQQVVVSGEFPSFGVPPSLAKLMAERLGEQYGAKEVHLPTEPISGALTILSVYVNKLGIVYMVPPPIAPPPPAFAGSATPPLPPPPPLPAQVWNCNTDCRRQRDLSSVGEQTLFMMVLSMDNPLRLYTSEWRVASTSPRTITLVSSNPREWGHSSIQVVLQRDTGRLLRYELLIGSPPVPVLSWQIHKFATHSGMLVPSVVTRKHVTRYDSLWMHKLYQFSLKSVSKTSQCDFQLPMGNSVVDYRLIDGVSFDNCLEPDIQQRTVQYRWSGSVPSETALKRMAYEQGKLPSAGKGLRATWVLFIPGMLMVVLAIYFYRRMRQSM